MDIVKLKEEKMKQRKKQWIEEIKEKMERLDSLRASVEEYEKLQEDLEYLNRLVGR